MYLVETRLVDGPLSFCYVPASVISSRIAGPGELFSSDFSIAGLRTKSALGNALPFRLRQLQLQCSTSISSLQASSPRSELSAKRAAKNGIDFCRADRNLQVKAWLYGKQSATSGWVRGRYRYFLLLRKVAALQRWPRS